MSAIQAIPNPEPHTHELERLPQLAKPLLQFILSEEVRNLRAQPSFEMEAGRSSKTLVKYPDLRVVLMTMKAGAHLEPHKTNARFALLCLSGHVRMHLDDASVDATAGELLAVDRDLSHAVEAVRESSILLFMAWPSAGC